MKYLAKVKLNKYAKAEKLCNSEKEAHIWAFEMDGELESVTKHADYAKSLRKEAFVLCKVQIRDNKH